MDLLSSRFELVAAAIGLHLLHSLKPSVCCRDMIQLFGVSHERLHIDCWVYLLYAHPAKAVVGCTTPVVVLRNDQRMQIAFLAIRRSSLTCKSWEPLIRVVLPLLSFRLGAADFRNRNE